MARPRKRHQQQELFRHGGKRRRAGRKPKGTRAGSPHKTRPLHKKRNPVHAVLRVHAAVGNLRKRHIYRAFREATLALALRELHWKHDGAFRIVHISIQRTHVHLLVEADNKHALSRGMQAFQISAAKHINAALSEKLGRKRRGTVFPDRFHQETIETPRQARRALSYVLNNWRKHREDQSPAAASWKVDPFSSAAQFRSWKEREDQIWMWKLRDTYDPLVVYLPKTWLLQIGWAKSGSISYYDVPSRPPLAAT